MINLTVPQQEEPHLKPHITVVGVGGAGGNAVNNMIADSLQGVDFVIANTDAQALSMARTDRRIQLGATTTQGLGAGRVPRLGKLPPRKRMNLLPLRFRGRIWSSLQPEWGRYRNRCRTCDCAYRT